MLPNLPGLFINICLLADEQLDMASATLDSGVALHGQEQILHRLAVTTKSHSEETISPNSSLSEMIG